MKISSLIEGLQKIMATSGDHDVKIFKADLSGTEDIHGVLFLEGLIDNKNTQYVITNEYQSRITLLAAKERDDDPKLEIE